MRNTHKSREVLVLFVAILCIASVTVLAALGGGGQGPIPVRQKEDPGSQQPIVDFAQAKPADQVEVAKRRIRGAKYDKSQWHINPANTSDTTILVDGTDSGLPVFPLQQSSVVILGDITGAKTYLSNDKTGVYTEFIVHVNDILKNDTQAPLIPGCAIEIARDGGQVRFSSGRVHLYKISGEGMPRVGGRYVLFLTGTNQEEGFQILTGYELRSGKVVPLDKLPNPQTYKNADETTFLNDLRIKTLTLREND
jgi:hypothetical protein